MEPLDRELDRLICETCALEHRTPPIPRGSIARCSRCGSEIARRSRLGIHFVPALSAAALFCWWFALSLPLARAQKLGLSNENNLLSIGFDFRRNQQFALGLLADLTVIVLPTLLLVSLPLLSLSPHSRRRFPGSKPTVQLFSFMQRWSMPEVLLLAVLVAFTKVEELAQAELEAGFYFLAASVILLTAALQAFRPAIDRHATVDPRAPSLGHSRPWAYLIAACAMMAPANLLPIAIVELPGSVTSDTIMSGIARLAGDGMWVIAAIVFVASILVPLSKVVGLLWLILCAHKKSGSALAAKTHRFLDFIGRWSMLDILLIGFLAGLIDFDRFASVRPGPAAPAFAAVVILTVLAVQSFDPRSLWPAPTKPVRK